MLDVTLEEIVGILGNPTRVAGHQYYFQCPVCSSSGGDTHQDNLLFNDRKGVLKCFACDEGAVEVLKQICAKRKDQQYTRIEHPVRPKQTKKWWMENLDNLYMYQYQAEQEVDDVALQFLKKRCITKDAMLQCGWGYDSKPNMLNIGASIVIPLYSLNHGGMLVGFELRQIGDKKIIKHTLDAPRCLCHVWGRQAADYIIICEGFIDAISLYLLLDEKRENYCICTPAHGCNDILHNLDKIQLSHYKRCFLLLDNDEAGDVVTSQILEQYPFFEDKRQILGQFKDINELWVNKCQSN